MNQKLLEIVKQNKLNLDSAVDEIYTEYNNSEQLEDKKIIIQGMDLDYVSRDVAEKYFKWLMNESEKDIIKQILRSNVFNGAISDEEIPSWKTEMLVKMLDAKRKLRKLSL